MQKSEKYEPQKKQKDHKSEKAKMPVLFNFMHNNDCVQLVIHAIIHGNQTI